MRIKNIFFLPYGERLLGVKSRDFLIPHEKILSLVLISQILDENNPPVYISLTSQ